MVLSQRKYALDLLQEACILGSENTRVGSNPDFWDDTSELVVDVGRYRRMISKLIYVTVTHPNISYVVGFLSQFMHEPRIVYQNETMKAYIKETPGNELVYQKHEHPCIEAYSDSSYASYKGDRKSTFGYCTYVGGNLVTW